MKLNVTRRFLLAGIGVACLPLRAFAQTNPLIEIEHLRPGEFVWHPDRSPNGPVTVIVSLPRQLVHVYRNGIRIAVSTCSSGKAGHETPTGVFVVLQKDAMHESNEYSDAPMPNMNRLTWSGIALHAGNLPGYPASHGCVRLPLAFSQDLFTVTHLGTPVIIAGPGDSPELIDPGLVLGGAAAGQFSQAVVTKDGPKHPSDWTASEVHPIVSVIASSADKKIILIENDVVKGEAPLSIDGGGKIGSHVFTMQTLDPAAGPQWVDVAHTTKEPSAEFNAEAKLIKSLHTTDEFAALMQSSLQLGSVLVLTDAPLHPDTRTGKDFVIMS
ncbi:L,D-transpeptidase (plasmid) [Rhizobium grahamii]|uniref:L,D-transpeptidase n=1 Tax=Rhizobium grahamii TaxID=1120045 RepID=A0A5Q0CC26_9HYPH|nr:MULTISPECIES: L,D-transpeptidase [Rhizobium]QFY63396.1 L,D-transpeptidase [Rhizobium grahamii]QRM51839.1 L,D-transpeptidase [Rhizobium sp. BG6]